MDITIQRPPREEQLAFNRARWEELCDDPFLAQVEGKIETDGFGQMLMSPPPAYNHAKYCKKISRILEQNLPNGETLENTPISTIDGVRAPDVIWISKERERRSTDHLLAEAAPEICVEVLSPRNTVREMAHKRRLFFEAGAEEFWLCDLTGNMTFFLAEAPDTAASASRLCPGCPERVEIS
jgi:Uma2 family endonuclease